MARYMLDTNICICLMKNQAEQVARRFAACYVGDVVMSAITYAQLQSGVLMAANPAQEQGHLAALVDDIPVVAFDSAAAMAYGPARVASRERKKDQLDKLIAAHALSLDVVLVTNKEDDFRHYPRLAVENWVA